MEKKNKKGDEELVQKINELEQKVGELTAGWQRCQADFQNFRRQSEEDRKKLIKMASSDLMLEILPVLDNFQLASKHIPSELETNNWTQGIKQIEKQLENILENSGLRKIDTVGFQLDPLLHEAIESVPSEKPEGEIIEEINSGYQFEDIVLRPSKVKVSAGK